jgi:DtxR family Mn-dependent transcriptional regulator
MELADRIDEILEKLWVEVTEHNNKPDINIWKDTEEFKSLLDNGLVSLKSEHVLTRKGLEEGRLCVRRHRLAERLLVDVFHVKPGLIHETGCKLEHILRKGLEDNICILLGHPSTCPHGRTIPAGTCCKAKKRQTGSLVLPLSEIENGQSGKIAYIHTSDMGMLTKIMAMGALPGLAITLIQKFPSYVFQIGHSQFAVDKDLAEQIRVWI